MRGDLSSMGDMSLWLAGEAGQAGLARTADSAALRASLDQHAAAVRDALGGQITAGILLSYARGFVDAAVARGWWPPHRSAPDMLGEDWAPPLDWESLRLAAVCRLYLETQGLAVEV
jgi:hypothetical protein